MSGHALHPEAYGDLEDIRGYIVQHDPDAADRVITVQISTKGASREPIQVAYNIELTRTNPPSGGIRTLVAGRDLNPRIAALAFGTRKFKTTSSLF
jgi:hypothetical protein